MTASALKRMVPCSSDAQMLPGTYKTMSSETAHDVLPRLVAFLVSGASVCLHKGRKEGISPPQNNKIEIGTATHSFNDIDNLALRAGWKYAHIYDSHTDTRTLFPSNLFLLRTLVYKRDQLIKHIPAGTKWHGVPSCHHPDTRDIKRIQERGRGVDSSILYELQRFESFMTVKNGLKGSA